MPGVVSFGYFSLDKQRKVFRLPVREPALKSIRRDSDTIFWFPRAKWEPSACPRRGAIRRSAANLNYHAARGN
ncbi:hypothetical protein MKLM6_2767 [Methylomonas koyamae]|nr:hypothetical protein MKLM6_2767 [Methylomonas koyamae]